MNRSRLLVAFSLLAAACGASAKPEGAATAPSDRPLASGPDAVGIPPAPASASANAIFSTNAPSTDAPGSAQAAGSGEVPLAPVAAGGAGGGGGAATGTFGGSVGPCPPSMALVGRFCIDKWEAHLATVDGMGKLVSHPHNQRPEAKVPYVAVSEPGVFPQGYMSRVESEAACKQAGKRLCSMGEWRTACSGKRHTTYPYGGHREAGKCSSGKKHLLSELFGKNGKAWKYDEHFNNPELLATEGFLDKTGAHDACQSDAGVFDMVGNLHEWVKDTVTDELVEHMEEESVERRKQPWRTGNGIFMGGFFSTSGEHGPGCTFTTIAHEPAYHDYSIGFRCCKAAEGLPKESKEPKGKK